MPNYHATETSVTRSPAQIPTQLQCLEGAISDVEKCFAGLVQRTEWVQRNVPTATERQSKPQAVEVMCPVAEQIRKAVERLQGLAENMTGLMSRIEL